MERSKEIAASFFKNLGYTVDDIAVADQKRADIDVFDGSDRYIVEVKEKLETDSKVEYSTIGEGNSITQVRKEPHARSNRLDGVFKHGAKQLAGTPQSANSFQLIWLHAGSLDGEMTARRAIYTFYGIEDLVPCSLEGDGVNCVYFHHSTAYARPNINGLIIVERGTLQLCINEYAVSCTAFQKSNLVRYFGDAVYDPSQFKSRPGTIIFNGDISRGRESDVLDELQRTTGVRYRKAELNRYSYW
jgi:hypothetical protein